MDFWRGNNVRLFSVKYTGQLKAAELYCIIVLVALVECTG